MLKIRLSKINNYSPIIFILFLLIGICLRLYLIIYLPLWFDEKSTLKIISKSFGVLFSGRADPTHPFGYYIYLTLWYLLSKNYIWLRISSLLFFIINSFILLKIGLKNHNRIFALILVGYYVFSGYFLIFDWQFRMYSGLLTLILMSLYLLGKENKFSIFAFTIVNIIGLYFDYGYLYYFIPLSLYLFIKTIRNKYKWNKQYLYSCFLSLIMGIYGFWIIINNFDKAFKRISWLSDYVNFSFVTPFFLGTYRDTIINVFYIAILCAGIYFYLIERKKEEILQVVLFCSIFSLLFTGIFTFLYKPILHVRNLQIVGLSVIYLLSFATYKILCLKSNYKFIAYIIVIIIIFNFFYIFYQLPVNPGIFLISFIR